MKPALEDSDTTGRWTLENVRHEEMAQAFAKTRDMQRAYEVAYPKASFDTKSTPP